MKTQFIYFRSLKLKVLNIQKSVCCYTLNISYKTKLVYRVCMLLFAAVVEADESNDWLGELLDLIR